ncbi:hypothetical protein ES703_64837 [subsurface metagenome]
MPRGKGNRCRTNRALLLLGIINLLLLLALFLLPPRDSLRQPNSDTPAGDSASAQGWRRFWPERPGEVIMGKGRGGRTSGLPLTSGKEERPAREARLALVIDDVGYNLENLKPLLALPGAITFAVLPNLPFSEEAARLIIEAGKELLLHCPMEPVSGQDPGPGALLTSHTPEEIAQILEANFRTVPAASGMNHHMGSSFTADEAAMGAVMSYLKQTEKFYLDSKTTADSVGARLALQYGVPVLERDVFIDNERSPDYMKQSFLEGVKIARSKGFAVLIGHIHSTELKEVLADIIPGLEEEGMRFTSLKCLICGQE